MSKTINNIELTDAGAAKFNTCNASDVIVTTEEDDEHAA